MCASACHLPEARNLSLSAAQHQQLPKNHNEIINGAEKHPIRASLSFVKASFASPNCPQNLNTQLPTSLVKSKPFRRKKGKQGPSTQVPSQITFGLEDLPFLLSYL